MTKWQYIQVRVEKNDNPYASGIFLDSVEEGERLANAIERELMIVLNKLGKSGWEVTGSDIYTYRTGTGHQRLILLKRLVSD